MKRIIKMTFLLIISMIYVNILTGQGCPGNEATISIQNGEKISANEFTFEVWLYNSGTTTNTFTGVTGGVLGLPVGVTGTFTVVEQPNTLGFTGFNNLTPSLTTTGAGNTPMMRWLNIPMAAPGPAMPLSSTKFAKFRFVRSGGTTLPTGLTLLWQPQGFPSSPQIVSYCNGNPGSQTLSMATSTLIALEGTLALRLVSFEVEKYERGINKIKWVTSSEANAKYYDIERSNNGHKWETIGRVESAGKTNQEQGYEYVDRYSLKYTSPKVLYYRLKMVDYDGREEYSDIKLVTYEKGDALLMIYPNPTTKSIHVDLSGIRHNGETLELVVTDMEGRVVLRKTIEGVDSYPLETGSLTANTYQLSVIQGDQVWQTRLVKVD